MMAQGTGIDDRGAATAEQGFFKGDWQRRLNQVVAMMREMSLETDPEAMVRVFGSKIRMFMPTDRTVSLSRRDLEFPRYRITRSTLWTTPVNPWRERQKLPLLEGGLFADLIYGDEPRVIDDLVVPPDDPAAEYFEGMRSLIAAPHFDRGHAVNMVVLMKREPAGFVREELPEWFWLSSLFGRATHNLVLSDELRRALGMVERELKLVADLQRTLLPKRLPKIPGLDLAAHYQTSRWAGGDYYDLFPLPDGRWGLLIADVSGHGTPAAVMMAVTHSIAHTYPGPPERPGALLDFINRHLTERYTADFEAFVTAFYGIYDPATRTLEYASAGHNPPRVKRCEDGSVLSLDSVGNLPLGVDPEMRYDESSQTLRPGDQIIFYTDGITEAIAPDGKTLFGMDRLDAAVQHCHLTADGLIRAVLDAVDAFTAGAPPTDDRTMLVAKVS